MLTPFSCNISQGLPLFCGDAYMHLIYKYPEITVTLGFPASGTARLTGLPGLHMVHVEQEGLDCSPYTSLER